MRSSEIKFDKLSKKPDEHFIGKILALAEKNFLKQNNREYLQNETERFVNTL